MIDRVAQVRLVGAVFQHRLVIGECAGTARGDTLRPVGEFLEHAVQHRLDRSEHIVLGDEAHFEVELVELARRLRSARASSSRKQGAIWK